MKHLIILFFFLAAQQAMASTVALLGRGEAGQNLADRIFASSPEFDFVERDRIQAVLQERKLSGDRLDSVAVRRLAPLLKADLFVLVSADKEEARARLLIFEPANGFRLADEQLPAENPEQAAAGLIRQKQTLIEAPGQTVFLSTTGIRDRALPRRHWIDAHRTADEFQRRLLRLDRLVLLEREELDTLIRERQLTGSFGKLAAASQLLALELGPGRSADEYFCRLLLYAPGGTVLFTAEAYSTGDDPAGTLLEKLAHYLKRTPPPPAASDDRKAEAARFFEEARWYKSSPLEEEQRMIAQYRTAWLLDPDNPEYRRALNTRLAIGYRRSPLPVPLLLERLELVNAVLGPEFGDPWTFRRKVPRGTPHLSSEPLDQILYALYEQRDRLTPEQQSRIRPVVDAYRAYLQRRHTKLREELLSLNRPGDIHISLYHYVHGSLKFLQPEFYFNPALCITQGSRQIAAMFRDIATCREKKPVPNSIYLNDEHSNTRRQLHAYLRLLPPDAAARQARVWAPQFRQEEPAGFQLLAEWLDLYAALREAPPRTRDELAGVLRPVLLRRKPCRLPSEHDELWTELIEDAGIKPDAGFAAWRFISDLLRELDSRSIPPPPPPVDRFSSERVRKFFERHRLMPLLAQAVEYSRKPYAEQVSARIGALDFPPTHFPPWSVDLAAELHPEFEIRRLYPAAASPDHLLMPVAGAAQDASGSVWLLLKRSNALTLHRIDPASGANARIHAVTDRQVMDRLAKPGGNRLSLSAGSAFLRLGDMVAELPLDGAPVRLHTDLPGKVVGVERKGDRIWFATEGIVLSGRTDGTERRVHLSKFDDTCRAFPNADRRYQFRLRGFFAEPGEPDRFLLIGECGFVRFDADAGTLEPLLQSRLLLQPQHESMDNIQRSGESVLLCTNHPDFYAVACWNLKQKSGEFRCGGKREPQLPRNLLLPARETPPVQRWQNLPPLWGAACLRNGLLYTSGGNHIRSLLFRPDAPARTPFWFFPQLFTLFPDPDGRSILLVTRHQLFKVTPQAEVL